ncbi:MAG: hypothetical protein EBY34_08700 [Alphaproteobacteria bacterium]|nr:hypothetical protein [Alphaproteobacteria bacterium]
MENIRSIGLIGHDILILGVVAGIATVPGAMLGRLVLKRMTNRNHEILVDLMALAGGSNFLWIAFQ